MLLCKYDTEPCSSRCRQAPRECGVSRSSMGISTALGGIEDLPRDRCTGSVVLTRAACSCMPAAVLNGLAAAQPQGAMGQDAALEKGAKPVVNELGVAQRLVRRASIALTVAIQMCAFRFSVLLEWHSAGQIGSFRAT